MSGRDAGRRPHRSRGASAGIAAVLLSLLVILYLTREWLSREWLRTPTTADVSLGLPPPEQMWTVLVLLAVQAVLTYLYFRERSRLKRALHRGHVVNPEPAPELRTHGPIVDVPEYAPEDEPEVEYEEMGGPVPAGASVAAPATEGKRDGEFSKLLQWVDDVSKQISGWASDILGGEGSEAQSKESHDSTPLALEEAPHRGTSKVSVPKVGAWTEVRARSAIEKYLRKRPWAPAADIAKELGMDLRLASRLTSALREESVR